MNKASLPLDDLLPLVSEAIDDALALIEQYAELDDPQLLADAISTIEPVRGAAFILGFKSCAATCGLVADVLADHDLLKNGNDALDTIGSSFLAIKACFEVQCTSGHIMPELLSSQALILQRMLKKPSASVSFYQKAQLNNAPPRPKRSQIANASLVIKKLRQMYQFGLSKLIKSQEANASLQMIRQASTRLVAFAKSDDEALVWVLITNIVNAIESPTTFTTPIKQLFLQVDRILAQVYRRELAAGSEPVAIPDVLIDDLVYLLRLQTDSTQTNSLLVQLGVQPLPYSLGDLNEASKRLVGPDATTHEQVATLYIDQLSQCRDMLSGVSQAASAAEYSADLSALFKSLKNVAIVVAWNTVVERLTKVEQLFVDISASYSDEKMADMIHELVVVETLVERVRMGASDTGEITNEYLTIAQNLSYQEVISAFSLAKRALGAFVDADYDGSHIANVPSALNSSAGALTILKHNAVANLVKRSAKFIDRQLINGTIDSATPQLLASFADALVALEFFVNQVAVGERDDQVLLVAEQSLAAVGAQYD